MLVTEIHTADIPHVFLNFRGIIEEKHWMRQIKQCEAEIKGNRFLQSYLRDEHTIAYQLAYMTELVRRRGTVPPECCNDISIYPAVGLMAQVLSATNRLGRLESDRFRRRVEGAFKNPDDMRALRLELTIATHFLRMGQRVCWPEIDGSGRFDLFVESLGKNGLEVECKSISPDKGRKIHRREILEFYRLLKPEVGAAVAGLASGLFAVITLPSRLPRGHGERLALAKLCCRAIFAHQDQALSDGTRVRIGEFSPAQLGTIAQGVNHPQNREVVERITGTRNKEVMVIGTKAGGAFVLAVQSARDDALLKTTFDTLSDAARTQLSQRRAGLLIAGFSGLQEEELRSIAAQDEDLSKTPTPLRVSVSRFLASQERGHIVGVGFLSADGVRPRQHGIASSGGVSYYFANSESSFWFEEFGRVFKSP